MYLDAILFCVFFSPLGINAFFMLLNSPRDCGPDGCIITLGSNWPNKPSPHGWAVTLFQGVSYFSATINNTAVNILVYYFLHFLKLFSESRHPVSPWRRWIDRAVHSRNQNEVAIKMKIALTMKQHGKTFMPWWGEGKRQNEELGCLNIPNLNQCGERESSVVRGWRRLFKWPSSQRDMDMHMDF